MVSVTFAQLGITGSPVAVRDVWQRSDVTGATSGVSANIPHEGALLYVLTPPGAGSPDAGTEPADASSGASSSGGYDGGSSGATASSGSSGAPGGPEGPDATVGVEGGSPEGAAPRGPNNSSGCSCRTAGATDREPPYVLAALGAIFGLWRRRRKAR